MKEVAKHLSDDLTSDTSNSNPSRPDSLPDHLSHQGDGGDSISSPPAGVTHGIYGPPNSPNSENGPQGGGNSGGHSSSDSSPSTSPRDGGNPGGYSGGGGGGGGGSGKPIVLDLDGDGVELVSRETSTVFYDINGDGYRYNMGWAGSDDGLLAYDKDGDNDITARDEISFVDYGLVRALIWKGYGILTATPMMFWIPKTPSLPNSRCGKMPIKTAKWTRASCVH